MCVHPDSSVDIGHYLQYLNQNCERDRLIVDLLNVIVGGDGNSDDAPAAAPEPQSRALRVVLTCRDAETGPGGNFYPGITVVPNVCVQLLPPPELAVAGEVLAAF